MRMGAQEGEVLKWDGCSSCLRAELVPVTGLEMWQGYLFVDYVVAVNLMRARIHNFVRAWEKTCL